MMPGYHIGTLDVAAQKTLSEPEMHTVSDNGELEPMFLRTKAWTTAQLHSKQIISSDTRIFTFRLAHDGQIIGLPIGQHLMIRLRDPVSREAIIRSYTPISDPLKTGYLDVLVKVYFDTTATKGGRMSQALDALPIGHGVDFKGPIGKFEYLGHGLCNISGTERRVSKFVMICAGSGVTPIFQVFRAVMKDKSDPTRCTVLSGNRSIEDILCKEDLDALAQAHGDRAQVIYTLTKASDGWQGLRGRIDGKLVEKHCQKDEKSMVLICGPEALEKAIHIDLRQQGWADDQLLFF
ncbi:MAG: hypothetical protein Q9198_004362 [Flavoplaca austrocitrina]